MPYLAFVFLSHPRRICLYYMELNKATRKDHFPFPFIDKVLDAMSGKNDFSFLDGFSGYNHIEISPKDRRPRLLLPNACGLSSSFLM
jgi:hypothetical protein